MAEELKPSLVGQEISGCEILQKVAMGGMGSVYKARHKALDRIVCVKILSPALTNDKKAVELFLTEARAIAELEHPNIVQVYNVGKEKGYYFIVMGFIEGQTLSQLVKRNKNLPLDTVLDLFEGILLGLDAAHAKGIIHRDIKPSNILINADMQPKIVDFGIAKKMDKEKGSTKTTELAGTAYFIAPEQALGHDLDTRADLYSVGASLYYVLTGQFPYNGKNTIDIIQKHINEPVPNPAELVPEIPAWLAGSIQKLMAKKPEDRFQTAKETYVYFQKMRAEEQLRIDKGVSLNLGSNNALKLVKEEKFSTSTQQRRQEEKKLKQSVNTKPSLLPSVEAAVVVPNAATAPAEGETAQQSPQLAQTQEAPTIEGYTPPSSPTQQIQQVARKTSRFVLNLAVKLPLFLLFTGWVAYVCFHLGAICSVHTVPEASFLQNLLNSFTTGKWVEGQVLFLILTFVTLVGISASAYVKEYARSTMPLFVLAGFSYTAGVFAPQTNLTQWQLMFPFLFSHSYYMGYLIVALIWTLSICFTFNRTLAQSLLGSALVALTVSLCYLVPHSSIAPNDINVLFNLLFFVSLFSAVVCIYYLTNRQETTTIIRPVACLLFACGCMWVYTTSGLVSATHNASRTIIELLQIKPNSAVASNVQAEQDVGIVSHRERFASLDQNNEISELDQSSAYSFLEKQIATHAPDTLTPQQTDFFTRLLNDNYYRGGDGKLKTALWLYALTLPFEKFNEEAPATGAYGFIMLALMALAGGFCVGSIVFKED